MIKIILSLFIPFRHLIEKMDVDFNQFISILRLRLILDDRRIQSFSRNKSTTPKNMIFKQMIGYVFMGLIISMFISVMPDVYTYFYLLHILIMVLVAMMIVSEFSSIIFDTSENAIIQPLPVTGNTIGFARNTHVFLHLFLLFFSFSLVPIIVTIIKFGLVSAVLFLLTLFPNLLFTLFLSNLLYLGIMRIATGERLKNLVMYFQVFIAILFMGGYQLGISSAGESLIENLQIQTNVWSFLIPPAFYAGFIDAFINLNFDLQHVLFIVESVVIPLAAMYYTVKYITLIFSQKLQELEQGDRADKKKSEKNKQSLWYRFMETLWCYNRTEKATFRMMWKMVGRERAFKQTLLPTIGYLFIIILLPLFRSENGLPGITESGNYSMGLYFVAMIAVTIPSALMIGEYKSQVWIYKSMPVVSPADFFKGFIKAAFVRFFLPIYLVLGIAVCAVWGLDVLPEVIVIFPFHYLVAVAVSYIQPLNFPFSLDKSMLQAGNNFVRVLSTMIVVAILGAMHYFLHRYFHLYGSLFVFLVYAGLIFYSNRILAYHMISWEKVDLQNDY